MDFKRFTRSMLLAQGGFAAFLRADPDDRGPILEQLTGTEIYSRISMAVHERRSEERGTLDLLQAGLAGVQPLDAGQEEELRRELGDLTSREARERSLAEGFRYAIRWREQLASLEEDLAQLDDLQGLWEEKRAGFAPRKTLLLRANLALALEPDYGVAVSLRDRQTKDRQELADLSETLPGLEEAVAGALTALQTVGIALHEARRRREEQSVKRSGRSARSTPACRDLGGGSMAWKRRSGPGNRNGKAYLRRMETAEKARQRNDDALQEVIGPT
jgi:exonuclease SbcC